MKKVLFVCMGNICRSPMAEGVFRARVREAGMSGDVLTDSAGTGDWHVGQPPDPRARSAAQMRGYSIDDLRARQVRPDDFEVFDLILAMDKDNLCNLMRLCPQKHQQKVKLYLEYSPSNPNQEVPDPYYGGASGFSLVLDMVEDAATGLLAAVEG